MDASFLVSQKAIFSPTPYINVSLYCLSTVICSTILIIYCYHLCRKCMSDVNSFHDFGIKLKNFLNDNLTNKFIVLSHILSVIIISIFTLNSLFGLLNMSGIVFIPETHSCKFWGYWGILTYHLGKQLMSILFLVRLKIAFYRSIYEYSNKIFMSIFGFIIILMISSIIGDYILLNGEYEYYDSNSPNKWPIYYCQLYSPLWGIMITAFADIILSIILTYLFISPLIQLVKQSITPDNTPKPIINIKLTKISTKRKSKTLPISNSQQSPSIHASNVRNMSKLSYSHNNTNHHPNTTKIPKRTFGSDSAKLSSLNICDLHINTNVRTYQYELNGDTENETPFDNNKNHSPKLVQNIGSNSVSTTIPKIIRTKTINDSNTDNMGHSGMMNVVIKYALLAGIALTTSVTFLMIILIFSFGSLSSIDNLINVIALVLLHKDSEKMYSFCCGLCHKSIHKCWENGKC